jgi:ribosomal protein S18 acetylase RimI-like enzyme
VAFITTAIDREASVGRIPNLAVDTTCQGQGVGKALVSHALDYFESEGLANTQIETTTTNDRGMRFYPAMGYHEVARKIYYFMPLADRTDR